MIKNNISQKSPQLVKRLNIFNILFFLKILLGATCPFFSKLIIYFLISSPPPSLPSTSSSSSSFKKIHSIYINFAAAIHEFELFLLYFAPGRPPGQCVQMAKLYFNILPFSTMKMCPIAYKIGQSKLKTLANTNWTLSKWPKCFNVVVKWTNFTKASHTDLQEQLILTSEIKISAFLPFFLSETLLRDI